LWCAVFSSEPIGTILALLAMLWLAAKLGGELALQLRFPAVAGELAAGLVLGALTRYHPGFPSVATDPALELLGNLGIIVLMFAVGLESTVPQMVRVASLGGQPLLSVEIQAAVVGALLLTTVAGPLGLGWALRRGGAKVI